MIKPRHWLKCALNGIFNSNSIILNWMEKKYSQAEGRQSDYFINIFPSWLDPIHCHWHGISTYSPVSNSNNQYWGTLCPSLFRFLALWNYMYNFQEYNKVKNHFCRIFDGNFWILKTLSLFCFISNVITNDNK